MFLIFLFWVFHWRLKNLHNMNLIMKSKKYMSDVITYSSFRVSSMMANSLTARDERKGLPSFEAHPYNFVMCPIFALIVVS